VNPIHPALARLARAAEHQDFAELEETLHVALRKPTWLRPEHRVGDPNGYMRHLLYIDPDDAFVITAITWLPGQVSPMHAHMVWCMYGRASSPTATSSRRWCTGCRTAASRASSRCTSTA